MPCMKGLREISRLTPEVVKRLLISTRRWLNARRSYMNEAAEQMGLAPSTRRGSTAAGFSILNRLMARAVPGVIED